MPGTQKDQAKKKPAKAASKPTYGLGLNNKSFELDLPSGNQCLARRPGAQGLIKAGLLDSMDQLTALVQTEHIDGNDPRKLAEGVQALAMDPKKIAEGLDMVDRCVAYVVVEPKVHLDTPKRGADGKEIIGPDGKPVMEPRQDGLIYADEVDLDDKMFIFNWSVGGTADLKSFREQSQQLLGSLSTS